ncbi:hypothetical protein HZ326_9754 [Fusarium oxysporum f. sp. albedinis]|nr:hypothetical protein HZ326_9754 [Fusarium oxysporum f. sp. albedinis]
MISQVEGGRLPLTILLTCCRRVFLSPLSLSLIHQSSTFFLAIGIATYDIKRSLSIALYRLSYISVVSQLAFFLVFAQPTVHNPSARSRLFSRDRRLSPLSLKILAYNVLLVCSSRA